MFFATVLHQKFLPQISVQCSEKLLRGPEALYNALLIAGPLRGPEISRCGPDEFSGLFIVSDHLDVCFCTLSPSI